MYAFASNNSEELDLAEGEEVEVLEGKADDWWRARNSRQQTGFVPVNYMDRLPDTNGSAAGGPPAPPANKVWLSSLGARSASVLCCCPAV